MSRQTDLSGRVAVITGASRGIGRDICREFARRGAAVVIAARTDHETAAIAGTIHKTAEELQRLGGTALALKTDVTSDDQVASLAAAVLDRFGRIDILVNNAAVNRPALFQDLPLKRWDLIMRVNLRGPAACIKAVLPHMKARKSGHIINISSVASHELQHEPFTGIAYDVSKAALNRLTLGLAEELRRYGIGVNALLPDNTATEGWTALNPEADISAWQAPGLWGRHAAFLAAQDPRTFTGNLLTHQDICALSE